jgi:hypothetical protein
MQRIMVALFAVGALALAGCSSSDNQGASLSTHPSQARTSKADEAKAAAEARAKAHATAVAHAKAGAAAKVKAAHARALSDQRAAAHARAVAEQTRQNAAQVRRKVARQAQYLADAKAAKKAAAKKAKPRYTCDPTENSCAPGTYNPGDSPYPKDQPSVKPKSCKPGDEMLVSGCWDPGWPQRKWRATHPGQPFPG